MNKVVVIITLVLFSLVSNAYESELEASAKKPRAKHGVAVGDVTSRSAVLWSRSSKASVMNVVAKPVDGKKVSDSIEVDAKTDFTGQVVLKNLQPDTQYAYKVWFVDANDKKSKTLEGTFKTAPKNRQKSAVKITWSGDFAGQNVCRDKKDGFPIFKAIRKEKPDLFIGLGDMIYADNLCRRVGRYGNKQVKGDFIESSDLENFWAHWRYAREDKKFQRLLATTPYFGIWDDHEVVNDFGPLHDTRSTPPYTEGVSLLPMGLQAFLDYTPIRRSNKTPSRLYRNVRWGKHVELFFLDNRQYRDANLAADEEEREKTMLGREQLTWLKEKIEASNATWQIIVSSVPVSIPTGFPQDLGRDGWANDDDNMDLTVDGIPQSDTGFEQELVSILKTLRSKDANTLFVTTDVHFAEVFRYTPFANDAFEFHEVVIGPGNAGLFPNRNFDTSLGSESLFFFGPESADAVTNWKQAKEWFNYGVLDISEEGELAVSIHNTYGDEVYSLALSPN